MRFTSFKTPLLAFAVSVFLSSACWGGNAKLSADLQGGNLPAALDVIIQYKQPPTGDDDQKVIDQGGPVKKKFKYVKGGTYHVPSSALSAIAESSNVAYISPDHALKGLLDQADTTIGSYLAASYNVDGTGIGVAVIDSGIANVADLQGKVVYAEMFNTNTTLGDAYGHGTHVSGIIAGSGKDSTGSLFFRTFHGVAEGVNLINLQVLDANGAGTDSFTIAAVEQAIALKDTHNIRVINLSLGRPVYESYKLDPLCQALEQAWKAGIAVVVAAGSR